MSNLINISKETTFTIQVNYCDFEVSTTINNVVEKINVTGIIIKPKWTEVKPNYFRSQILKRKKLEPKEKEKISEDLLKKIYYLNIKDYTDQELRIASDFLASEWTNTIWSNLTEKDKGITVTLKDETVLEHILKMNKELFQTKSEIDEFCTSKGLKINDFIVSGNFSLLENKLQEISIRLEMEQFYARRFLFTEILIKKLNHRIYSYSKNNEIEKGKKEELKNWITGLKNNNCVYEKYNDFQQLYEMPKQNIQIKKSKNVTFVNGKIKKSKLYNENSKPEKKSSIVTKIGASLAIIVAIMEIIKYWDDIIKIFNE